MTTIKKHERNTTMYIRISHPEIKRRFKSACAAVGLSMQKAVQTFMEEADENMLKALQKRGKETCN